jgi:hypothetical protein
MSNNRRALFDLFLSVCFIMLLMVVGFIIGFLAEGEGYKKGYSQAVADYYNGKIEVIEHPDNTLWFNIIEEDK